MNLECLMQAIAEKEACVVRKQKSIKSLSEKRELLTKINEGKFSVKTMLKTQNQKTQKQSDLVAKIQQTECDIDNWDKIKKMLTIYLAEIAIPAYRKRKVAKYTFAMQMFSFDEMVNAEKHLACWGDFKELTDNFMHKKVGDGGVMTKSIMR